MARILALDWEQTQIRVAVGSTGRKGARIEQVLTWPLPAELTAASAEGVGKALREALKTAGIAASAVLASVSRDRVILKTIHYPQVAAKDEPALVRFQTAKELSESPDDVIIDYSPISAVDTVGEREAMAIVVRKDILRSLQGLCRAAGLKLLAATARPVGVAGALERVRGLATPPCPSFERGGMPAEAVSISPPLEGGGKRNDDAIDAVVSVGPRWAELAILRGQTVLLARALSVGPTLAGDIKRTLTVFAVQKDLPIAALYLAGNGDCDALFQTLHDSLGIPVGRLDPFLADDVSVPADERGSYLAGIGLLHLWSRTGALPINFAAPKEPKPTSDPRRKVALVGGVAAAILVVCFGVYANRLLAGKKAKVAELITARTEVEATLKGLAQDRVDIEALKDWEHSTISWVDEIYDLAARFPHKPGLRVNKLSANTSAGKKNAKDKIGELKLTIAGTPGDDQALGSFVQELGKDPHLRASSASKLGDFQILIEINRQPLEKYTTKLVAPPRKEPEQAQPPATEDEEGDQP